MDDDKIKDLLHGFQPRLSSDQLFIARLQRSMDAVEIVKQHNARQLRHSRIAVIVAAVSGIIAGVILTLLFPMISEWLSSMTISLPSIGLPKLAIDGKLVSWMLIGGICVTIAIHAYELTLTRLSTKASLAK